MKAINFLDTPIVDKFDNPIDPSSNWYRVRREFRRWLFHEMQRFSPRVDNAPNVKAKNYVKFLRNVQIMRGTADGLTAQQLATKYNLSRSQVYQIIDLAKRRD